MMGIEPESFLAFRDGLAVLAPAEPEHRAPVVGFGEIGVHAEDVVEGRELLRGIVGHDIKVSGY